ncbi:hypothetical protein BE04_37910 [Sorangium cellulosum]|uniref:NERD domain-containing protein n=1 Tax=Sorangium cellulosum TaxID=56 RepID=A0A150P3C1_SORCE|nr:hypothetical protein BE04_37910 [Sorangium cellulosum]
MSFVHDEGKLRFAFDGDWKILKWDDHDAYVGGLQRFQETKAVDFFGLYLGEPYFIEVKDFRGHRIKNKARLSNGELAREVAYKVRDTVAGMVWACGRSPLDGGELRGFVRPVLERSRKVPVVLWLEEDRPPGPADASTLGETIKRELTWLNPRVLVTCRSLAQTAPVHGLEVTNVS